MMAAGGTYYLDRLDGTKQGGGHQEGLVVIMLENDDHDLGSLTSFWSTAVHFFCVQHGI
jgi:hypothetical protein